MWQNVGSLRRLWWETNSRNLRDYTTFQTPFGALQLVTLPMGWMNSVLIFHDDVTFILQAEIPHVTIPYINDISIKGLMTMYQKVDDSYETIPENPGICRFVWEHFENLNRVVQRMKYCGGTFSGPKLFLCVPEIFVLGHRYPWRSTTRQVEDLRHSEVGTMPIPFWSLHIPWYSWSCSDL
jgi:hypothetical protein